MSCEICARSIGIGFIFCENHITFDFWKDYCVIDDKVYRIKDKTLVLVMWYNPCDDERMIYNPKVIQSCLEGKGTLMITDIDTKQSRIIEFKHPNTYKSCLLKQNFDQEKQEINNVIGIKFIPPDTYYQVYHEYSGPSTGYDVSIFNPKEWNISFNSHTNKKFKRIKKRISRK